MIVPKHKLLVLLVVIAGILILFLSCDDQPELIQLSAIEITGSMSVGDTLTANVTPSGATVEYQWARAIEADGVFTSIAGATGKSYELSAADENHFLKVTVIGIGKYSRTIEATTSGAVQAVQPPDDNQPELIQLSAIEITGGMSVGDTLTANVTPSGATVEYQWARAVEADGVFTSIAGASGKNYELSAADENHFLKVTVVGNGKYSRTIEATTSGVVQAVQPPDNVGLEALGANLIIETDAEQKTITVSGEIIIDVSKTVLLEEGYTLIIDSESSLTINAGQTLIVEGNLLLEGGSTLIINGNLQIHGDLTVEDDFTVAGNLLVEGEFVSEGSVTVGGVATVGTVAFDSNVTFTGSLTVTTFFAIEAGNTLSLQGDLTLIEESTIAGNLVVIGNLTAEKDLTVEGDLSVTGALTVAGELIVEGTLELSGDATVVGGATIKSFEINGAVNFVGNLTLTDTLIIANGKTFTLHGNLVSESEITIADDGTVEITGNLNTTEQLTLASNTTVSITGNLTAGSLEIGTSSTFNVSGTLAAGPKPTLIVRVATNSVLTVGKIDQGYASVKLSGGGTFQINDYVSLTELEITDNSLLKITDLLVGMPLKVSGNGHLMVPHVMGAKFTVSDDLTITGTVSVTEIALTDNNILTVVGDIETGKISGKGTLIVLGSLNAQGNDSTQSLEIEATVTVDLTAGVLAVTGDIDLKGTILLAEDAWDALDENGLVFKVANEASIQRGDADIIWYTLSGAKAQYFGRDNHLQLRFIEGEGANKVTPAGSEQVTTETTTRVGSGVTFELNEGNQSVIIGSRHMVLEAESTTKLIYNWWTENENFIFENGGTVAIQSGATVKDYQDKIWIGEDSGEWQLTSGAELVFERADDVDNLYGITTLKSEHNNEGKFIFKAWAAKDDEGLFRYFSHRLIIGKNATFEIDGNLIFDAEGEIIIESGGTLHVPTNKTLEVEKTHGIKNYGAIIINGSLMKQLVRDGEFFARDQELFDSGYVEIEGGSLYVNNQLYVGGATGYFLLDQAKLTTEVFSDTFAPSAGAEQPKIRVKNRNVNTFYESVAPNTIIETDMTFVVEDNLAVGGTLVVKEGATLEISGAFAASMVKNLSSGLGGKGELLIKSGGTLQFVDSGAIRVIAQDGKQHRDGVVRIEEGAIVIDKDGNMIEDEAALKAVITEHTIIYLGEEI